MTAIPGATGLGDVGDDLERIVTYDRLAEAAAANGVVTLARPERDGVAGSTLRVGLRTERDDRGATSTMHSPSDQ